MMTKNIMSRHGSKVNNKKCVKYYLEMTKGKTIDIIVFKY